MYQLQLNQVLNQMYWMLFYNFLVSHKNSKLINIYLTVFYYFDKKHSYLKKI